MLTGKRRYGQPEGKRLGEKSWKKYFALGIFIFGGLTIFLLEVPGFII